MRVINFHDLNEKSENRYDHELLKYFSSDQIDTVEYDLSDNPAELLLHYGTDRYDHYDLIVGAGFGAILAIMFSRMKDNRIKTVLINPMYPFSKYAEEVMPGYPYKEMVYAATEWDICWNKEILRNVYLILGKDDDVSDVKRTPGYFYKENVFFVEGGHSSDGDERIDEDGWSLLW